MVPHKIIDEGACRLSREGPRHGVVCDRRDRPAHPCGACRAPLSSVRIRAVPRAAATAPAANDCLRSSAGGNPAGAHKRKLHGGSNRGNQLGQAWLCAGAVGPGKERRSSGRRRWRAGPPGRQRPSRRRPAPRPRWSRTPPPGCPPFVSCGHHGGGCQAKGEADNGDRISSRSSSFSSQKSRACGSSSASCQAREPRRRSGAAVANSSRAVGGQSRGASAVPSGHGARHKQVHAKVGARPRAAAPGRVASCCGCLVTAGGEGKAPARCVAKASSGVVVPPAMGAAIKVMTNMALV